MLNLRRREVLSAAGAAALLPGRAGWAQDRRARTLRLVPSTDLVFLDPMFVDALVSIQHGYHVFDTLYGVNHRLEPQPQMAEGHEASADGLSWTIRLRPGLVFHDGQPVRAADCIASLARWSKRDTAGRVVAAYLDDYTALDERTFRVRFKQPFPHFLHAIGKPHITPAFIMPERLAQTPITSAVTEMVGSGPYRFLAAEWRPGSLVAYSRFEGYVPRQEPADWTSGGKVAHFDRVEWHVIPDQATAFAALQRGEVDWMESVSADLLPLARRDRTLRTAHDDPFGKLLVMRFNHLQPPFNNVKLRQVMMKAVHQEDYFSTLNGGDPDNSQDCFAALPCTLPTVRQLGQGRFGGLHGDGAGIAEAARAAGYAGETVVVLNAADSLVIAPLGRVTADLLTRAGFKVELQEMDFGTMLKRLTSQEPVGNGGWSVFCTAWPTVAIANPMQNLTIRGEGRRGYAGWYESAAMEGLVKDWIGATTPQDQAAAEDRIHRLALADVPTLALGMFKPNMAYRADLDGVLSGSVRYPWNLKRS